VLVGLVAVIIWSSPKTGAFADGQYDALMILD
jgi:hypothetical protein